MSSESLGAVGASPAFNEQRALNHTATHTHTGPKAQPLEPASKGQPSPAAQGASPAAGSLQQPQQASLTPAQASEALANQALEKAQEHNQQQDDDPQQAAELSADELKDMLTEVNNLLYSMNRALRFEVHDKTEDLIVRVVNTKTDEVIRQYPREDVIERRERLLQGDLSAFSAHIK